MTKGSSSSSSSVLPRSLAAPTCRCSRPTVVFVSWTDDNPGRRFNRCEVHGFVSWVDTADPTEWQKNKLDRCERPDPALQKGDICTEL